jgi:hypothetical protein
MRDGAHFVASKFVKGYDYGVHRNEAVFKMQWEPEAKQEYSSNVGVDLCLLPSLAPLLRQSARILDLAANRRLPAGLQAGVETVRTGTIGLPGGADPVIC